MKISFIVPAYNAGRYVLQCLQSLYDQNLHPDDFEVIVVNDGSTDGSLAVIGEFAVGWSNLVIINQENQGVSVARNTGLKRARGRYVMFVDADDYLLPLSIGQYLNKIEMYDLDFIRGEYTVVDENGKSLPFLDKRKYRESCSNKVLDGKDFCRFVFREEFFVWLYIIKKSFLVDNDLKFLVGISMCEDLYFLLQMCLPAKSCMYLSTNLYAYRMSSHSAVACLNRKKLEDFLCVLTHVYAEFGDSDIQKTVHSVISRGVCMIAYSTASLPKQDRKKMVEQLNASPFSILPVNGTFRQKLQVLAYNLFSVSGFIFLKQLKDFIFQHKTNQ
ncbi:glycosyltransferase [Parabacteroides bouchesdurhonensis]|uniref:glycosyltransferase n=1 Tax=Parabacteroides bouchesdurhonensis TaxID=1936995 RepID=UPI000C8355DB|nr:glycosyltransferase [Parabacteroides bouchesdurhonensis]